MVDKCIKLGYNICLPPKINDIKDINQLYLSGITDIKEYIDKNTYISLYAELRFGEWKK